MHIGHDSPRSPVPQQRLDALRLRLEHERVRLLGELDRRSRSVEREESDPAGDDVDRTLRAGDPEVEARLEQQYRETLRAIDAAIARMENGSYGINVRTGEVIPVERLEAVPWAIE
jgi:DnaK suppressor protein